VLQLCKYTEVFSLFYFILYSAKYKGFYLRNLTVISITLEPVQFSMFWDNSLFFGEKNMDISRISFVAEEMKKFSWNFIGIQEICLKKFAIILLLYRKVSKSSKLCVYNILLNICLFMS